MTHNSQQDDSPPSPTRRSFLRGLIGITSVALATATYGHYVGGNELEVVRTRIRISGWPEGRSPLRVGLLSDFHCHSDESVERAERATAMLLAESPDVVLLGGDFITYYAAKWIKPMIAAIAPLASARLGAYGVLGNHDWWCHNPFQIASGLDAVDIPILMNRSVELSGYPGVWIVGLDSGTDRHDRPELALQSVPPEAVKILLVHEPDLADKMPPGFALQLSGHSHAGQVRVFGHPLYTPPLARRYKQGLMQAKDHPIYVTRGVGMMDPEIRIDCPPEVSVLTLSG